MDEIPVGSPDPAAEKRRKLLGDKDKKQPETKQVKMFGIIQYLNPFGVVIGYTITASINMLAVKRSICFHEKGHKNPYHANSMPFIILLGVAELVFSQIPDFDQISLISIVAAVMSFTYSTIGLALGVVQVVANGGIKKSLGILEGLAAGLPLITWPLFNDQFYNERLVVDMLQTGIAVGSGEYVLKPSERKIVEVARIEATISELMSQGEAAEERRRRARDLRELALRAVQNGGSSYSDLSSLIAELREMKMAL